MSKMTKKNPLGLVIATKEEAFWMRVVKETEGRVQSIRDSLKLEEAILQMSKLNLRKEKDLEKRRSK